MKIEEIENKYPEFKTFLWNDVEDADVIIEDMFKSIRFLLSQIKELKIRLEKAGQ